MKVYQDDLKVGTKNMNDFIRITDEVQVVVDKSDIKKGIAFVNSLHNTGAVMMQENDPAIFKDTVDFFDRILPQNGSYEHDYEGNGNATAHQKESLLGNSVTVPIKDGRLVIGRWQDILFAEFFEPRQREVVVTVIGE